MKDKNVAYICSVIVDIILMAIGLSFLVNLGLQILSLIRLIQFLSTSKLVKTALILSIIILSQLYLLDIFLMLSPLWGTPAYYFTNYVENNGSSAYFAYRYCYDNYLIMEYRPSINNRWWILEWVVSPEKIDRFIGNNKIPLMIQQ